MKSKQFKNKEPIEETKNRRCAKCGKYHTQVTNNQKLSSHTLADKIYLGISISIFLLISILIYRRISIDNELNETSVFFTFFFFFYFLFLFLIPKVFSKKEAIRLCSTGSFLLIILTFIYLYKFLNGEIYFILNTMYNFAIVYALAAFCISYSFTNIKHLNKKNELCSRRIIFFTLLLFLIIFPYLYYIFTGSRFFLEFYRY